MGMTLPREYGGPGRSFLDVTLVIEEMSAQCGVTGRIAVEGNMGAISTVMQYGTEAQKKRDAECVLSGDKQAICITEPDDGSAATALTTAPKLPTRQQTLAKLLSYIWTAPHNSTHT